MGRPPLEIGSAISAMLGGLAELLAAGQRRLIELVESMAETQL